MLHDELLDQIVFEFGYKKKSFRDTTKNPNLDQILAWYNEIVQERDLYSSDWFFSTVKEDFANNNGRKEIGLDTFEILKYKSYF